jgi:hypothetical protein
MPNRTADEVRLKNEALAKLQSKIQNRTGTQEASKVVPISVKFLASEMQSMGISFFSQTIDRHCINKKPVLDINSLIVVLRMLGF